MDIIFQPLTSPSSPTCVGPLNYKGQRYSAYHTGTFWVFTFCLPLPCSPLQPWRQGGSGAQLCRKKQAIVAGNSPDSQSPPSGKGGRQSLVLQQTAKRETGQNQSEPQLLFEQTQPTLHRTDEQSSETDDIVARFSIRFLFTSCSKKVLLWSQMSDRNPNQFR